MFKNISLLGTTLALTLAATSSFAISPGAGQAQIRNNVQEIQNNKEQVQQQIEQTDKKQQMLEHKSNQVEDMMDKNQ